MAAKKTAEKAPGKPAKASNGKMDLREAKRRAVLLKQASDGTRLHVLLILAEGEQNVGAMCEQLGSTQPALSHHLAIMRHGGIVAPRREGKSNFYSLTEIGHKLASAVLGVTGSLAEEAA